MSKSWDIKGVRTVDDRQTTVTIATVHELEYHGEWMEDCYVMLSVKSHVPVDFRFGDYLEYRNERFEVNYDPNVIKKARRGSYGEGFTYDNIKLYPFAARMKCIGFKDVVLNSMSDNANKLVYSMQGTFAFFCSSVEDLADRIQANLNRDNGQAWAIFTPNRARTYQRISSAIPSTAWSTFYDGDGIGIEGKTDIDISVSNIKCWDALKMAYTHFELCYYVKGYVIVIGGKPISAGGGYGFEYGKGNGLYEIERTSDESQEIVTKLFAYGSERNLPLNYYANLHKTPYFTIHEKYTATSNGVGGYTEYWLKTDVAYPRIKTALTAQDYSCSITDGTHTITAFANGQTEEDGVQYLVFCLRKDVAGSDLDFFNAVSNGQRIFITNGVNMNTWPLIYNSAEEQGNYPALLSVNRLMLPGFPDKSLFEWVRTHGATGYNTESGQATWKGYTAYFSRDPYDPWIMSMNVGTIGLREGTVEFNSDDEEIYPTIEGTGFDEVEWAEQIEDNGYLDGEDATFTLRPRMVGGEDGGIEWGYNGETVSISMKDGYCVGREFTVKKAKKDDEGRWVLTLERCKDESLHLYFPYRQSGYGDLYQIVEGNRFVVLGIPLPRRFVEIAAEKMLEEALRQLSLKDHQKYTYLPKIDEIEMARQHDRATASGGSIVSIHDTITAGMQMRLDDDDLNLHYEPFIDNITIKENGNNGIPTYDVVLRDEKELTMQERIQSQIEGGLSNAVSSGDMLSLGNEYFLSKRHDDATEYLISFFAGLIADKLIQSPEFAQGMWTVSEDGTEHNDGKGFAIWNQGISSWWLEIDYATVRNLMRAREIYTDSAYIGEVTNQTVFQEGLRTLGNIILGKYAEGVEGGIITPNGHVEIETLITRGLARLQELFVVNDSTFGGNLSSIDFISAFLGGKGWAIQKKTRINSAGVEEEYYTLEIDNVTVRNTLRVYEFVVSQLRGEFDNYVFAAMMEVHHYDAATGRVWLTPQQNQKAVSFKRDDVIMVQQYEPGNDIVSGGDGYITKGYKLLVTDVGTGGMEDENGDRLDWLTFTNFVSMLDDGDGTPETLIAKGDTFTRRDNLTDPERKGLMTIMTVGPNTPYMDVHYGLETDPNDALKVRLGNLTGIRSELFGWLEDYGAYIPNLYAVGKMFNRQTGESYSSSLTIIREKLRSAYSESTYNIDDTDNFLSNGFFARGLESWTVCAADGGSAPSSPSQEIIGSGGVPLSVNGAILAYQDRLTAKIEEYAGMTVLHILGMGVWQDFAAIRANSTHKESKSDNEQNAGYYDTVDVYDTLYMGIRMIPISAGTLSVRFVRSTGSLIAEWSQSLNASREWTLVQARDSEAMPWKYTGEAGRMIVSYTGECYVRFVALTTDAIANSKVTYSTLFEQNARRITLQAAKEQADHETAMAEIQVQYDAVMQTVTGNKSKSDTMLATILGITVNADGTYNIPDSLKGENMATWRINTNKAIIDLAAEWDPKTGKIKDYSTHTQTAKEISDAVATADGNALAYVAALKGLINTDVLSDSGNAYATFKSQTSTTLSQLAGKWDASGNLIGYSTTSQTAEAIKNTVESYGYLKATDASKTYSTKSEVTQLSDSLTQSVRALEDKYIDISDMADWEAGGFNASASAGASYENVKATDAARIRTKSLIAITSDSTFTLASSYYLVVAFFNSSKGYISRTSLLTGTGSKLTVTVPSDARYCALFLSKYQVASMATSQLAGANLYLVNAITVTEAQIKLFITENRAKELISVASISADQIDFTFTKNTSWIAKNGSNATTVMTLDTAGNLKITGQLTQSATIVDPDGTSYKSSATTLAFKAQYIKIPTGSTGITTDMTWAGGSTIIFWGTHTSGNVLMRLPSQSAIRSALGLSGGANFVVEMNFLNLASYDYVYLKFSDDTGSNTTYPRLMTFDNGVVSDPSVRMGNGDLIKILLLFNDTKYNAYIIARKNTGWE